MTLEQACAKVRDNLNDYGITYYSEIDIYDSIQDAYDEVVIYSECNEKIVDVPVFFLKQSHGRANPWINVKHIIPDYYRIIAILNRTTRQFLAPGLDRDNDDMRLDWQLLETGNAIDYIINGTQWLALPNGYYTDSHKPLRFFYKATAPVAVLSDLQVEPHVVEPIENAVDKTHVFRILNEYQKLIEYYSTADLLEQNQEFQKAQIFWNMYEPLLEEYRKKILNLAKSDRIFARMLQGC